MKKLLGAAFISLGLLSSTAFGQQTGVLIGGGGLTVFNTLPMSAGQILVGQGAASNPVVRSLSGDCSLTGGGVITCLNSNGSAYGTAAFANTGASGTAVPLLNSPATISALYTFTAHTARGNTSVPTLTSCGTSPAILGDDGDGEVTLGTGSPTGCVITFGTAYTSVPLCTVTWQATPLASQSYTKSASAITLVQTGTSSNKINYHCVAQSGG